VLIWDLFNLGVRTLFPKTALLLRNINILATEQGQWRSMTRNSSVDRHGNPLPWYTYSAIEYLETLDVSECRVFEYGAGNSSLYWAARARTVTSVEDDMQWYERLRAGARPNQTLLLAPERGAYVAAVGNEGVAYDVIVIDGSHRAECARVAIEHLAPGGLVVVDNSDWEAQRPCGESLRGAGFIQVDFCGFGPINDYRWATSVFFRPGFALRRNDKGPRPVGGLR
jgi:hypothetical protein